MKRKKLKLVEISWIDAEQESGWSRDDPHEKDVIIKTYGILVRKDKKWVVHADSYIPDTDHWGGRGKIPTGMVKKIVKIKDIDV